MNLRRSFRYSLDDVNNDTLNDRDILDDEEQDQLVQSLVTKNAKANQFYLRTILLISLISILPYLRILLSSGTILFSTLSITSLLSTAYLLVSLPPGQTGISIIDRFCQPSFQSPIFGHQISFLSGDPGPIKGILPYLNVILCITQILYGTMIERRTKSFWFGLCCLPTMNYGTVLIAAWLMGGVNPERDLSRFKYNYKGA